MELLQSARLKHLETSYLSKVEELKKNTRKTLYKIPCAECPKAYVGQSTGTLKKRNQEHANLSKKKHKKKLLQSTPSCDRASD